MMTPSTSTGTPSASASSQKKSGTSGKLDGDAGEQKRAGDFERSTLGEQVACDHRSGGEQHHGKVGEFDRARARRLPNQNHREQSRKFKQAQARPCNRKEQPTDGEAADQEEERGNFPIGAARKRGQQQRQGGEGDGP